MDNEKVRNYIVDYKQRLHAVVEALPESELGELIRLLAEARLQGRKIFVCGNGGSAATATHFVSDMGKGASLGAEARFQILALTDNIPWMTSLANDLDYSEVFLEQLKNFASPGDLLIAFSGSGNSPNVIKAVTWARETGLVTVGLTGRPGGELGKIADYPVFVESGHMGRIEDGHFLIQHILGYFFMEMKSN